jgi:N-acetylglutamate synthase-like GNAT family acetyltransferase
MNYLASDVRRATLDDLPQLMDLWRLEKLPAEVLEKRFTEFQIVTDAQGKLVGAIGMQMADGQGKLHSELFPSYELADELRPLFWERFKMLAKNHGLNRVWTQLNAPYWQTGDFHDASEEEMALLPPQFAGQNVPWVTVMLREELASIAAVEKELAMFREMERANTEKIFKQARVFKISAAVVGLVFLGWAAYWLIVFFRRSGVGPFGGE